MRGMPGNGERNARDEVGGEKENKGKKPDTEFTAATEDAEKTSKKEEQQDTVARKLKFRDRERK